MFTEINDDLENPILFAQKHNELLQLKAQEKIETLKSNQELHQASVLFMGIALHLARGLGANPAVLIEHWIKIAKNNGALE